MSKGTIFTMFFKYSDVVMPVLLYQSIALQQLPRPRRSRNSFLDVPHSEHKKSVSAGRRIELQDRAPHDLSLSIIALHAYKGQQNKLSQAGVVKTQHASAIHMEKPIDQVYRLVHQIWTPWCFVSSPGIDLIFIIHGVQ